MQLPYRYNHKTHNDPSPAPFRNRIAALSTRAHERFFNTDYLPNKSPLYGYMICAKGLMDAAGRMTKECEVLRLALKDMDSPGAFVVGGPECTKLSNLESAIFDAAMLPQQPNLLRIQRNNYIGQLIAQVLVKNEQTLPLIANIVSDTIRDAFGDEKAFPIVDFDLLTSTSTPAAKLPGLLTKPYIDLKNIMRNGELRKIKIQTPNQKSN